MYIFTLYKILLILYFIRLRTFCTIYIQRKRKVDQNNSWKLFSDQDKIIIIKLFNSSQERVEKERFKGVIFSHHLLGGGGWGGGKF